MGGHGRLQLVGDRIVRRLYDLDPAFFHPLSAFTCVPGTRASGLKSKLKALGVDFHTHVLLHVGVNDLVSDGATAGDVISSLEIVIDFF